jgi:hypothetical protein
LRRSRPHGPRACAGRRSTSSTASGPPRRRRSWPGWTWATPPLPSPVPGRPLRALARLDAELIEVNPLALLRDGAVLALDCKLAVDDASLHRQERARGLGTPERLTDLELRARALDLKYFELDGDVGVLANGAGLTMTTMDVVAHLGGRPANFMEIGGEAYTKSRPRCE